MTSQTIGSRRQVWNGTAKKTSGGLTKSDLIMSHGHIVSKSKHFSAKKEMRLLKHGYGTKKGKFGFVKVGTKRHHKGRKMRGGHVNIGHSLSPNGIDGQGITDYSNYGSVGVQEAAGMAGGRSRPRGMAGGRRRSRRMAGGGQSSSSEELEGQTEEAPQRTPFSTEDLRGGRRRSRRMAGGGQSSSSEELEGQTEEAPQRTPPPPIEDQRGGRRRSRRMAGGGQSSSSEELEGQTEEAPQRTPPPPTEDQRGGSYGSSNWNGDKLTGGKRRRRRHRKMRGGTTSQRFNFSPADNSTAVQFRAGSGN